jgi:hypothetical protein
MGRFAWFALVCGCSYSAPTDPGLAPDSTRPPDPDGMVNPDAMTIEPDTSPPPDTLIPPTTSDLVASADTWIDSFAPNTVFANDPRLLTDGGPPAVTLMRFDLSGIATTAQVISAELHVFTTTDEGQTVTVFPVLEAWSETQATWNARSAGVLWSTAGAAPPSRGTTAVAQFTPNLENTEFTAAFDAATVQGWVSDPDSNLGIALTSVAQDGVVLRTRLSTNGKPFLRVLHVPSD